MTGKGGDRDMATRSLPGKTMQAEATRSLPQQTTKKTRLKKLTAIMHEKLFASTRDLQALGVFTDSLHTFSIFSVLKINIYRPKAMIGMLDMVIDDEQTRKVAWAVFEARDRSSARYVKARALIEVGVSHCERHRGKSNLKRGEEGKVDGGEKRKAKCGGWGRAIINNAEPRVGTMYTHRLFG